MNKSIYNDTIKENEQIIQSLRIELLNDYRRLNKQKTIINKLILIIKG